MQWIVLFLITFLVGCTTPPRDAESADLYLQLGTNQLKKGFPAQALTSLLKAEKLDSRNPQVQNYLGLTYFVMKQYKKAVPHFQKAVSLDPKFTEGRNNFARTLIEVGRFQEARQQLSLVLNDLTYPQQALALTNMGLIYVRERNYQSALPYLQKALKIDKSNCLTYSLYGRSLYEMNNYRAAIPVFDSALPLCKSAQVDEAHYFAAWTYYKSGEKSRGIALMNETLLLYPDGDYQEQAKTALEQMKFNR